LSLKVTMRKVFAKLLSLFVILLCFNTLAMVVVFSSMAGASTDKTLRLLGSGALGAGLIALCLALPAAVWAAGSITKRVKRVVVFARRMADGDLDARLEASSGDEMATMEMALNRTAERLNQSFAEIKSHRQELAAMLDSMQEAVVAITSDGLVRWSNTLMQQIAGTQIRTGRSLVQSVRDPELLSCVRGALEEHEVHTGRASTLAPGRVFEINATPLPGGGALAVLHDVTRIEAAERARRDFIANVSHELRTPLTSIQGYAETLIEDPLPDPEANIEFLRIILKNATRMNRLTDDLLALASLDSPDNKLARRPIRASTLIDDGIAALGGLMVDSGVELQFAGAPDAPVMADPDAMNQVFGNLIENAVKYAGAGRRVKVGARLKDSDVEFFVRDYGPGIPSEHLDRIFERFYRVDKARSRESGGTGLGLAIVKHIIMALGGRIWAESELGAGATFFFALPVVQEDSLADERDTSGDSLEEF
jgi:two-component system, OmpR family, phosphate regulon sensor histidine kinase PhoR